MAHVSKVAVSRILADSQSEDGGDAARSRGEYKKQRELEEMRKAGTAPAAVDESGKDINPHIPQYISEAPWYVDPKGPTLTHQRQQEEKIRKTAAIDQWYPKGVDVTKVATKFRKGACENCGAVTHKKRDCLERPRKVGAKFSGANLAPDEHLVPSLDLTFDGKRDRWNGYDSFAHQEVLDEYKKLEHVKREVKRDRLKAGLGNPEEDDGAPSSDEDEDKYVEKMDMPGTKVDAAERYTVRNLRIREDTAKYLRNLDPNSAHYDPKTRSMRKNPYEDTEKKDEEVEYAGDNFVRISGDTVGHAQAQLFAWEAGSKGLDVHALAEPTKLEALKREYVSKKNDFKDVAKNKILDKYGGEQHLMAPPRELIFAQTEDYVEYTRHGKLVKGQESGVARSKYEENVYHNNHTSVWGSFWSQGKWGYKCCHSTLKNSYCTGAKGKQAAEVSLVEVNSSKVVDEKEEDKEKEEVEEEEEDDDDDDDDDADEVEEEKTSRKKSKKKKKKRKREKEKEKKKQEEEKDFETQVAEAMKKQDQHDNTLEHDDRKRGYNTLYENKAPTEAELEAYYRKRPREDDPMKDFL